MMIGSKEIRVEHRGLWRADNQHQADRYAKGQEEKRVARKDEQFHFFP